MRMCLRFSASASCFNLKAESLSTPYKMPQPLSSRPESPWWAKSIISSTSCKVLALCRLQGLTVAGLAAGDARLSTLTSALLFGRRLLRLVNFCSRRVCGTAAQQAVFFRRLDDVALAPAGVCRRYAERQSDTCSGEHPLAASNWRSKIAISRRKAYFKTVSDSIMKNPFHKTWRETAAGKQRAGRTARPRRAVLAVAGEKQPAVRPPPRWP